MASRWRCPLLARCRGMKSWVVQIELWKEQGPAGDVFFLQGSYWLTDQKRNFQTPFRLRKKEGVVFCTSKYLCSPDVRWRPPCPQEPCKISSNLYQFHALRKSKSSPKIAPASQGPLSILSASPRGHDGLHSFAIWVWRLAASTSPGLAGNVTSRFLPSRRDLLNQNLYFHKVPR